MPPLLVSRFLCGLIAAGTDSGGILYVAEISDDRQVMLYLMKNNFFLWLKIQIYVLLHRIRGALSSISMLARNTGYMVAFAVGAYVEYVIVPYLYIGLPILFLILFLCLPNTAPFLVRHGKYEVSESKTHPFLYEVPTTVRVYSLRKQKNR